MQNDILRAIAIAALAFFCEAPLTAFPQTPSGQSWSTCWAVGNSTTCATAGTVACTPSGTAQTCSFQNGQTATCGFASGTFECATSSTSIFCYGPSYPPPAGDLAYGPNARSCYATLPPGQIAATPNPINFGLELLNTTSGSYALTFRNTGGQVAHVNPIRLDPPWSITYSDCYENMAVSPGGYCTINIAFSPTQVLHYHTTSYMVYTVNGQAQAAWFNLDGDGVTQYPAAQVSFGRTSLVFGSLAFGGHAQSTISITNAGHYSSLTISSITATTPDYFVTSNGCTGAIPPAGYCQVTIEFAPSALDARSGTLTVVSDGATSPDHLPLTGTGVGATYAGAAIDDVNAGGMTQDNMATPVTAAQNSSDMPSGPPPVSLESGSPASTNTSPKGQDPIASEPLTITVNCSDDWDDCFEPMDRTRINISVPPPLKDPADKFRLTCDGLALNDAVDDTKIMLAQLWDPGSRLAPNGSEFVLDPIHAGFGNKHHVQQDFVTQGVFPLAVVRTYNSTAFNSSALKTQDIGPGWTSNWDRSISATANTARVTRGDGKSYVFTWNGSVWTTDKSRGQLTGSTSTGWQYKTKKGAIENYNASGRLLSVVRLTGHTYNLTYNASGQLASVQSPMGRTIQYVYDTAGRVSQVVLPSGQITYGYDVRGRLVSVTYPDGRTRQYRYEDPNYYYALTSIIDEAGQTYATFTYDLNGRATSNAFAGNVGAGTISYSTSTSDTTTTTPDNTSWTRSFVVSSGRIQMSALTAACSNCGTGTEHYYYDAYGQLGTFVNRAGVYSTYYYDSRGLPYTIYEGSKRTVIAWHPTFRLPTQITTDAGSKSYQYDSAGRVIQESMTVGTTTRANSYTYNAQGLLSRVDGPRTDVADVTTYTYDALGNVATVTNALGQVTTYNSYNAYGQPLSVSNPDGTTDSYTYDAAGRVLTKSQAGQTTTNAYNTFGLIASFTDANGIITTYDYDAAHRLIGINKLGERKRFTLDPMGRITKEEVFDNTNYLVRTSSTVYDGVGRVIQTVGANGQVTAYAYDASGNQTQTTDPNGYVSSTYFDSLNRPYLFTDPAGHSATRYYDAPGNLSGIRDNNGNLTSYSYNGFGDNTQITSPDAGITSMTVNETGTAVTKTDARGATTTSQYDALERLIHVTYSDGNGKTLTYDVAPNGVGRVYQMTDSSGTTTYSYDSFGHMTAKTQVTSGISRTLSYGRDAVGRITSLTYPSGKILTISYQNGRPASLTFDGQSVISGIQYFPFGPVESWLFGDGKEFTRYIDTDGRIGRYLTPTGERRLTFDAGSRVMRIDDVTGGVTTSQVLTYTSTGGLSNFSGFTSSAASENQSFTYDPNGNRTTNTLNGLGQTYSYAAGSNRISSITRSGSTIASYSLDASGNVLSDGVRSFVFNGEGRLAQVTSAGVSTTFAYNGDGLRVKKTTGSAALIYMYDESGHLLGEYDQAGNAIREVVWLTDIPVAVSAILPGSASPSLAFIWTDHLDTPRAITKPSPGVPAVVLWKWDSLPFGETPPNENQSGVGAFQFNLRFPGQYFDIETGLSQNWRRDYDPATGRYIEPDPKGQTGGLGLYQYASNSPTRLVDPTGLVPSVAQLTQKIPTWLQKESFDQMCKSAVNKGITLPQLVTATYQAMKQLCGEPGSPQHMQDMVDASCQGGMEYVSQRSAGIPYFGDAGPFFFQCRSTLGDWRNSSHFQSDCKDLQSSQ